MYCAVSRYQINISTEDIYPINYTESRLRLFAGVCEIWCASGLGTWPGSYCLNKADFIFSTQTGKRREGHQMSNIH